MGNQGPARGTDGPVRGTGSTEGPVIAQNPSFDCTTVPLTVLIVGLRADLRKGHFIGLGWT